MARRSRCLLTVACVSSVGGRTEVESGETGVRSTRRSETVRVSYIFWAVVQTRFKARIAWVSAAPANGRKWIVIVVSLTHLSCDDVAQSMVGFPMTDQDQSHLAEGPLPVRCSSKWRQGDELPVHFFFDRVGRSLSSPPIVLTLLMRSLFSDDLLAQS